MKTAIILTGELRSFEKCLPNLRWTVFRHFPEARFFVCCHDDENAHKASLLKQAYPDKVEVRVLKQPPMVAPKGCPAKWTQGQPYMHEPYHISVPPAAVLGQLWFLREGWRLYEETRIEEAELVIRCRPDLWFHSFEMPEWDAVTWKKNEAYTPIWGSFGGCNDRFALLNPLAAKAYFETYDRLSSFIADGAPLHPETLVKHSMNFDGVRLKPLNAIFSTLRTTGEMRPPEITVHDIINLPLKNN